MWRASPFSTTKRPDTSLTPCYSESKSNRCSCTELHHVMGKRSLAIRKPVSIQQFQFVEVVSYTKQQDFPALWPNSSWLWPWSEGYNFWKKLHTSTGMNSCKQQKCIRISRKSLEICAISSSFVWINVISAWRKSQCLSPYLLREQLGVFR
jgi:hypothetical protein